MIRRVTTSVNVLAIAVLTVLAGGVAVAGNGGNFILGQLNGATAPTRLANSGVGEALRLSTAQSSTPNLAVSNSARIPNLNSDLVDGLDSSAFARKGARTTLVRAAGSPAQNGAALRAAVAAVPAVSALSPWLIELEPGTYDMGTVSLTMRSFVGITGAGPALTKIWSSSTTDGVVLGHNAPLRSVTVTLQVFDSGNPVVRVPNAAGAYQIADAVVRTTFPEPGTTAMESSHSGAVVDVERVTLIAGYGFINAASTVDIRDSRFFETTQDVASFTAGGAISVTTSRLDSLAQASGLTCNFNYGPGSCG